MAKDEVLGAWTVAEACQEFEKQGMPVDPRNLAGVIRFLPGFQHVGEGPSGGRGGRGQKMYQIGELQLLHARLAEWLVEQPGQVV